MQALTPWVKKLERAFAQSVLSTQYRLVIDLGDLLRADPEARWASWQRARQAGVLSPNDVRREEGWPASSDPTADSIEPPVSGGKPADQQSADSACASAAARRRGQGRGLGDRRARAWRRLGRVSRDIPDPDGAEFAPIKADLARLHSPSRSTSP